MAKHSEEYKAPTEPETLEGEKGPLQVADAGRKVMISPLGHFVPLPGPGDECVCRRRGGLRGARRPRRLDRQLAKRGPGEPVPRDPGDVSAGVRAHHQRLRHPLRGQQQHAGEPHPVQDRRPVGIAGGFDPAVGVAPVAVLGRGGGAATPTAIRRSCLTSRRCSRASAPFSCWS
ncbi:MAG: hypothetical protein MZW92_38585 [Comamonadaceae bacterium]|nr:hypothetical protein [Comamonadaceae bacterium]